MAKDKKKIIAGAGILGAATLAYILARKKAPPSPPTYTCPYCGETFATYEELQAHIQAQHPEQPPVVDYGRLWGYIKDALTSERTIGARVYLDDVLQGISDTSGGYGTNYVPFGSHSLRVEANNYQIETIIVDIQQESAQLEILLDPLPEAPTEWTEGVIVERIEVSPTLLYLGDTVRIDVHITYPTPVPDSVHATVLVDGEVLSGDFETIYARVTFNYTPTRTGNFTILAQDKSAAFTVLEDVITTYYSPFGGKRMPRCTDILVPDVAPFSEYWPGGYTHPGGDLIWSNLTAYGNAVSIFWLPLQGYWELKAKLAQAYPIEWEPSDAVITAWDTYYNAGLFPSLLVMAVEYSCQEYWDSKEELAEMIAVHEGMSRLSGDWATKYGSKIDLTRGLRDWVKDIEIWATYYNYTYTVYIRCPYCDKRLTTGTYGLDPSHEGRINAARFLLDHIETSHPSHPLTEPAWF